MSDSTTGHRNNRAVDTETQLRAHYLEQYQTLLLCRNSLLHQLGNPSPDCSVQLQTVDSAANHRV